MWNQTKNCACIVFSPFEATALFGSQLNTTATANCSKRSNDGHLCKQCIETTIFRFRWQFKLEFPPPVRYFLSFLCDHGALFTRCWYFIPLNPSIYDFSIIFPSSNRSRNPSLKTTASGRTRLYSSVGKTDILRSPHNVSVFESIGIITRTKLSHFYLAWTTVMFALITSYWCEPSNQSLWEYLKHWQCE